jgi:hypothetical protein
LLGGSSVAFSHGFRILRRSCEIEERAAGILGRRGEVAKGGADTAGCYVESIGSADDRCFDEADVDRRR